jgi:hypothetical protein
MSLMQYKQKTNSEIPVYDETRNSVLFECFSTFNWLFIISTYFYDPRYLYRSWLRYGLYKVVTRLEKFSILKMNFCQDKSGFGQSCATAVCSFNNMVFDKQSFVDVVF